MALDVVVTRELASTVTGSVPDQDEADEAVEGDATSKATEEARRERLQRWYADRSQTLLWRIGQQLAANIVQADRESEIAEAEREHFEEALKVAADAQERLLRRSRLGLFGRTAAAVALCLWIAIDDRFSAVLKPAAIAAVALAWFILLVVSWFRTLRARSSRSRAAAATVQAALERAFVAAARRADAPRLRRRYNEYLAWATVLGHLLHRPWTRPAVPYDLRRLPLELVDPATFPAACGIAYASLSSADVSRLVSRCQAFVFTKGWLRRHVDATLAKVVDRWTVDHGLDSVEDVPDPFRDASTETDGLRNRVLKTVSQPSGRPIDESPMIEELVDHLESERTGVILERGVVTNPDTARPLPSPDWFERPEGLDELAAEARGSILRILQLGPTSSWRGTAFALPGDGLIGTCRHCVEGGHQFIIRTEAGDEYPAEVVAVSDTADAALLRITENHTR